VPLSWQYVPVASQEPRQLSAITPPFVILNIPLESEIIVCGQIWFPASSETIAGADPPRARVHADGVVAAREDDSPDALAAGRLVHVVRRPEVVVEDLLEGGLGRDRAQVHDLLHPLEGPHHRVQVAEVEHVDARP